MTRIGGICIATILVWVLIELAVQFGLYDHGCRGGEGECVDVCVRAHACVHVYVLLFMDGDRAGGTVGLHDHGCRGREGEPSCCVRVWVRACVCDKIRDGDTRSSANQAAV